MRQHEVFGYLLRQVRPLNTFPSKVLHQKRSQMLGNCCFAGTVQTWTHWMLWCPWGLCVGMNYMFVQ